MEKMKKAEEEILKTGMSRRNFCKTLTGISIVYASSPLKIFAAEEDIPPEPNDLDVPTPWQDGDPKPVKLKVPAVEPEQTSTEAPPCQPMEDDPPEQPTESHVWVYGYWWWNKQKYMWVPGYWALPPRKGLVYISGYWIYKGNQWIFVRGGWGKSNTTTIEVYPRPRPVLTALVITAPRRIRRRHRRWRYHAARRVNRRVNRRVKQRVNRRQNRRKTRRKW